MSTRTSGSPAGGRLIEGWAEDITTCNPVLVQDTFSALAAGLCFEPLVTSNATGELIPALAEEVPAAGVDGLTYTVRLSEGLRWSDGHPLTADDVVFTYGLMTDPDVGSPYRGELERHLADVEAVDARTVVLRTTHVHAPFLVAHGQHGILPKHVLGDLPSSAMAGGDFNSLPSVVSGVFAPVRRTPGQEIAFVRNPRYHRGPGRLAEFSYRVFPDGMAVADALRSGEVDIGLIDPSRLDELADVESLDTVVFDLPSCTFYAHQLAPGTNGGQIFADERVRQALLLGLNRETMVKEACFGMAHVADSVIPLTSWAYASEADSAYPHAPERAARLLDEAGWVRGREGTRSRDGRPLRFQLVAGSNTKMWTDIAHAMQDDWRRLGADVSLSLLDFPDLLSRVVERREFDVCLLTYTWGQDPDQSELFSSAASGPGGANCFGFSDAEADRLMSEAVRTVDRSERRRLYENYQRVMARLVPAPAMFFMKGVYGINKRVKGYALGPHNQFGARPWMRNVHIDEGNGND